MNAYIQLACILIVFCYIATIHLDVLTLSKTLHLIRCIIKLRRDCINPEKFWPLGGEEAGEEGLVRYKTNRGGKKKEEKKQKEAV